MLTFSRTNLVKNQIPLELASNPRFWQWVLFHMTFYVELHERITGALKSIFVVKIVLETAHLQTQNHCLFKCEQKIDNFLTTKHYTKDVHSDICFELSASAITAPLMKVYQKLKTQRRPKPPTLLRIDEFSANYL